MKINNIIAAVFAVFICSITLLGQTIPQVINYQGVLQDASGTLVGDGDYNITFRLYPSEFSESILWSESKVITINDGLLHTLLGSTSVINLPFNEQYWLGITISSGTELSPRIMLASVPYSFMTMNVMDGSITASKLNDNSVTTSKIADGTITSADIGSGQVVMKVNGIRDSVNLIAGTNISITPVGNNITITSTGGTGNGDITSVTAGSGLTGGGTTGDVSLSVANNSITTVMLQDNSVISSKISDGTLTATDIAAAQVVKSLNTLKDNVTLVAGNNIAITPDGNNITISSSASGLGGSGTANYIPIFTSTSVLGNSGIYQNSGNIGIGTTTPGAKMEVAGQLKLTGGSPGLGKVLTSDANGLASWQTLATSPWLINSNNIYYSSGNVGVGLNNPTGIMEIYGNSIDSYPTLLLSEADGFARVSFRTMLASSKHWALAGHTNTDDNTSQWHINYFNGSVGKNIFSVYGNSNVGFDGNVGIGTQTPSSKLEVSGQVKITGGSPGFGKVLTSDASGLATWQQPEWQKSGNNIYYANGNVAIGMNLPRYQLTVYNDNLPSIGFYNSTSGTTGTDGFSISTGASGSPVWIWNWENSNIHFGTNNLNRMVINASGQVDIMGLLNINSDVSWGAALQVNGSQALWWDGTYFSWGYDGQYNYFADKVTIGNAANPGYMLYVQGSAYATGTWSSSDARLKKNITGIDNPVEKLTNIRGTRFEFRSDEFPDYQFASGPQYGFVAQEIETEFPEVVNTDSNGYKSVNYNEIIPVLVEAVKEQQRTIEELKKKIELLEMR